MKGILAVLAVCGIVMVGSYAALLALSKGITREEVALLPMGRKLLKLFPEKDTGTPSGPAE